MALGIQETMKNPLEWPRPYFTEAGGTPFLFYVAYGDVKEGIPISPDRYRFSGIPDGIDVMRYHPQKEPSVVDGFRTGYLWDALKRDDDRLASAVAVQKQCVIVRGELQDCNNLNDFRNVIGLLTHLLDCGAMSIFDPQMFKWWRPGEWRDVVFDSATPSPRSHVTILVSEDEENTEWFHTRGLRKFGRPDISVHHVRSHYREGVIDLCERYIEFQALGGVVKNGEEIRMRTLPEGMQAFHAGDYEDPEFNNVHVDIKWPKAQQTVATDRREDAAPAER